MHPTLKAGAMRAATVTVALAGLAAIALAASEARAQTSTFSAEADGIPEPVPLLVRQDMQRLGGRVEVTIVPDAVTSSGQHFFEGTGWGLWIWQNQLHGNVTRRDGTLELFRLRVDSDTPLPGTEVVAGQPLDVTVSWTPSGVGIFVDGLLRAYLEGEHEQPPGDLVYGARPDGRSPYHGTIEASVYPEPAEYDPCENFGEWGDVQTPPADPAPIPQPTCAPPEPDGDAKPIIEGQAQMTLRWLPPTQNEDGSTLDAEDIDGYVVFWDTQSRSGRCEPRPAEKLDATCYGNDLDLTDGSAVSAPLTFSLDGETTLFFTVATYVEDEDGVTIGRYSNEVARRFVVDITEPDPETPVPGAPTIQSVEFVFTCVAEEPGVTCEFRAEEP